jgi:hypothetical protein
MNSIEAFSMRNGLSEIPDGRGYDSNHYLLNILAGSIGGNMPFSAIYESSTTVVSVSGACRVPEAHKSQLETTMGL